MTLFHKKGSRNKKYKKKQRKIKDEQKNEIRLPCVFEKFLLMIHLLGSTDIARIIIEMLQQMNRIDTIDFREFNSALILSNYGNEWKKVMNSIHGKYIHPYDMFHYFGGYYMNHYNINHFTNNTLVNITNITNHLDYTIDSYEESQQKIKKEKREMDKRKKREKNLYKSFHKHENKRRNKMIKNY